MFFIREDIVIKNNNILFRNNRKKIFNLEFTYKFVPGDILSIFFWNKGLIFNFEGICLSIKSRKLKKANISLILRNIIFKVGVELTISFIYNRLFFLKIQDYKRKRFYYKKSKLFYLRNKLNRESRVKIY